MDEIVKLAQIKWPNVPHCYGWLALDARGAWRMRDERAQKLHLPGDVIRHPALLAFIGRNYAQDDKACWFFQNGPQKVYVSLAATPFIARTDPAQGFLLQTGEIMAQPERAWITEHGSLILGKDDRVAQLDDRDLAECLQKLRIDGAAIADENLIEWLASPETQGQLSLELANGTIPVQRLHDDDPAGFFGFNADPAPPSS